MGSNGLNMIYFIYINHYKKTNTRVLFVIKYFVVYKKQSRRLTCALRSLISAIAICYLRIMIALQAASNYPKL